MPRGNRRCFERTKTVEALPMVPSSDLQGTGECLVRIQLLSRLRNTRAFLRQMSFESRTDRAVVTGMDLHVRRRRDGLVVRCDGYHGAARPEGGTSQAVGTT